MMLRRTLKVATVDECTQAMKEIEKAENDMLMVEAHGVFQAKLVQFSYDGKLDTYFPAKRIQVSSSTLFDVKCTSTTGAQLVCYHGTICDEAFKHGYMICIGGRIAYFGDFVLLKPHGRGVAYHSTGEKHTEGAFENGQPHGHVKQYRRNGYVQFEGKLVAGKLDSGVLFRSDGTIYFTGQFQSGMPSVGTWSNAKNVPVFTGSSFDFHQAIGRDILAHQCTFTITSTTHVFQQWFNCLTCFGTSPTKGVCVGCSKRCHKGHALIDRGVSDFYCDCGDGIEGCVKCIAGSPCESGCDC